MIFQRFLEYWNFKNVSIHDQRSAEEFKMLLFSNRLLFLTTTISAIYIPYFYFSGFPEFALSSVALVIAQGFGIYALRTSVHAFTYMSIWITVFSFWLYLLGVGSGNTQSTIYILLSFIGFPFLQIPSKFIALRLLAILSNIALICTLAFFPDLIPRLPYITPEQVAQFNYANIFVAIAVLMIQFSRFESISRHQADDLMRANKLLVRENQMSNIGVMSATLAHEINNPLGIIHGFSELLEKSLCSCPDPDLKAKNLAQIGKIKSAAQRISDIIKGLKGASRSSTKEQRKPLSTNILIDEVLSFTRPHAFRNGVEISINCQGPYTVICNQVEISQILVNLMNNSFDAIQNANGKRWVQVGCRLKEHNVEIFIADCGNGISTDIASKIFEPFFTTKEHDQGTGLGLSIARSLAVENGGNLEYRLTEAGHTSFVLTLPLAK